MKKRLVSLDMAKGVGILCVLLKHCFAVTPPKTIIIDLLGSLMFIFFFISGYNYKPGKRTVLQSVKQRAKQILIPFYLYSAVIIAFAYIFYIATGEQILHNILNDTISFYCGTISRELQVLLGTFWFLPVMFLSSVLFFLTADYALKSTKRIILVSLALTVASALVVGYTSVVPWRLPLVPVCTAVMMIGAYAGQRKFFENPPFKGAKLAFSILCAAALSVVLTVIFGSSDLISIGVFGNFGGWSVFTAVIICLVQIYMLVFGCELMSKSELAKKVFSWFGVYSMQILVTHLALAKFISELTGWSYGAMELRGGMESVIQILQNIALCLLTIGLLVCWLLIWGKIKESAKKGR